jgi:hypothetical protein
MAWSPQVLDRRRRCLIQRVIGAQILGCRGADHHGRRSAAEPVGAESHCRRPGDGALVPGDDDGLARNVGPFTPQRADDGGKVGDRRGSVCGQPQVIAGMRRKVPQPFTRPVPDPVALAGQQLLRPGPLQQRGQHPVEVHRLPARQDKLPTLHGPAADGFEDLAVAGGGDRLYLVLLPECGGAVVEGHEPVPRACSRASFAWSPATVNKS